MTAQALAAAPDLHDAPFLRWLADSVAAANPVPPDKPPPPKRTRREAHQLVIGGLNALAYAAQNERVRLSALYALGRIHGYEYIADRILDLAASTVSETVQLAALNVAARGLGILAPLRSRLDPEEPFEAPIDLIRLFPGDEDQLDELNRPPDPEDPPDRDSLPIPDLILDFVADAPPEPMPGFASKADPQPAPQTPPPDHPRKPADRGPNPIRLTPRNPLPRLPAYPSLPQLPAGRSDPAHGETPNETPGETPGETTGETPEPNNDQPAPEPGGPPPDETRQTRENASPPRPTPPTDLPRPPP